MNVFNRIATALESILSVQRQRLGVEEKELVALQRIATALTPVQKPGPVISQSIVFGVPK